MPALQVPLERIVIARRIFIENTNYKKDCERPFADLVHTFSDYTDAPAPAIIAGRIGLYFLRKGADSPMTDKPPYRVPLMAEIAALPWNGFKVVSTFAGAGGSSTGYRMAGFKIALANEFVPIAQDSYRANMNPSTIIEPRGIQEVTAESILEATGLKRGELDIFDGSPPCQAFSTAGKRSKGWGTDRTYEHGASQKNENLFEEYIRVLDGLQPKVFVAENVSGLVKGVAKGFFLEILAALKACGYRVEARVLDAQWLGVPQMRQRLIFVGVRNDLGLNPVFPKPLSYQYTVREALPWIVACEEMAGYNGHQMLSADQPSQTILLTGSTKCEARVGTHKGDRVIDGPAPTVLTHGRPKTNNELTIVEQRVVHDERGGHYSHGDITDKPSAPIRTTTSGQFKVETTQREPRMIVGNDAFEPIFGSIDQVSPTIMAGGARTSGMIETPSRIVEPETDISRFAIGAEWDKIKPGEASEKFFSLIKPGLDDPCPTLTASKKGPSSASVVHPVERRKFTIAEVKRICAFPDDFVLKGSYSQQWERLGNSVPPVMMAAIATAIRDQILIPLRDKEADAQNARRP